MFRLFQEDLRASDADREQVAEVLKRHYAVGRLTSSELSARVEAALAAVGLSELDALTRDLPPLPLPPVRTEPARQRRVGPLLAIAAIVALLVTAQAIPAEMWTLLIFFGLPILMMVLFGLLPFALPVLAVAWLSRSLGGAPPAQPRRLGASSGRVGPWHVAEFEHHPRSRARRGWVDL